MTDDVRFIKHEPCPECGSKDNLGVWSDGHKWCFGCGHYVPAEGKTVEYIRTLLKKKVISDAPLQLPPDNSMSIPLEPRTWLSRYDITGREIAKYNIRWSEQEKALLFLVEEQGKLIFFQKRLFRGPEAPKYLSEGSIGSYLNVMPAAPNTRVLAETIVVVEDFVSAMKVADKCDCIPLFGSHLPKQLAVRLSNIYHNMIIWLDNDKAKEAMKFKREYEALYDDVKVIITSQDPKEYTHEVIGQKLKYAMSSH